VNVYVSQAALLCEDCGVKARETLTTLGKAPQDPDDESSYDSDDFPKGPYPDGGGESDSPKHCDHCQAFLENPLTDAGLDYVKEQVLTLYTHGALRARLNGPVIETWREFYDIPNPYADTEDSVSP
jgi:hypothetical protein